MQILTTLTTLAASYSTSTSTSNPTSPSPPSISPSVPPHDGGSGGLPLPFPPNTTIYYNSTTSSYPTNSTACPPYLGNSTIYADVCTELLDYPVIAIAAAPDNECTITVYQGSRSCGGGARKDILVIPAGQGCMGLEVEGGGRASGVWTCR
ncbi:hypothetical protein B0A54_09270 [Friedmanniomyces endolithicus]|uniref:Uncharacterized protein n=1 Tax=Friedmanniomyces endolithicus TaxID=329885 RepID=A0A4V5N754_9PEZI|nr:hypothetical protein B0A54_09270 [Friedmanniomyces endolithicus]